MTSITIWRLPKVMAHTGLARSTIYELIGRGKFPAQVNLGPRTVGWVADEVVSWIDARVVASRNRESNGNVQERTVLNGKYDSIPEES